MARQISAQAERLTKAAQELGLDVVKQSRWSITIRSKKNGVLKVVTKTQEIYNLFN